MFNRQVEKISKVGHAVGHAIIDSHAEKIYKEWAAQGLMATVSPAGRADGRFDTRLAGEGGAFGGVATKLVALRASKGRRVAAEQAWKLLEKFKRRHDEVVAVEALKSWKSNPDLRMLLDQYPASGFRNLGNDAQAVAERLDFRNLVFPKSGRRIRILKVLGQGGVGGVVMLGEDQNKLKYAVKHLPTTSYQTPGFGRNANVALLTRTRDHLQLYFEASVTTTCLDMIHVGDDQLLLLQLGEGSVNYTTLSLADVIAVFQDLDTCYNYSKNYMNVDVAQDVSVLHLDIHGENLMRFNGRLRMIDFGQGLIHNPKQGGQWRNAKPVANSNDNGNADMYFQLDQLLLTHQDFGDHTRGSWKKYIANWQKSYRVPHNVLTCQGCKRQYPTNLKLTECFACGSSKLETSKLRQDDVNVAAQLRGVSPAAMAGILDTPYAGRTVQSVSAQQYGCVVLTAVLIKEIWAATEGIKGNLGMGACGAKAIQNVDAYTLARAGLHNFKAAAETGGVVEMLLLWFDEMMIRLFAGEKFTAHDAALFFGGGRTAKASRDRRHSTGF